MLHHGCHVEIMDTKSDIKRAIEKKVTSMINQHVDVNTRTIHVKTYNTCKDV